jgi:poly-gamma-glutamate synthesis protein (capsule biosynthesis protein)
MARENEIVLVMGGDTGVISNFSQASRQNPKYASFLTILKQADIVSANLECVLTNCEYPDRIVPTANKCDPSVARDFSAVGVKVFSMSHRVFDFGNVGFFDTMKALTKANIQYVGGGKTLEEAMQEKIIEVKEQKVAFLSFDAAFAETTQAKAIPSADGKSYFNKPGLAPINVKISYRINPAALAVITQTRERALGAITIERKVSEESLQKAIEKIKDTRKKVDFLVMMLHWGAVGDEILEHQPPLGHTIIDAGADLICGTHPHRPHGVEIYKGKPIFYSLGNFIYQRTGLAPYLGPEQTIARVRLHAGKVTKTEIIATSNDDTCVSIADVSGRDRRLDYLKKFEEKNKFGTKYSVREKEAPIEVGI